MRIAHRSLAVIMRTPGHDAELTMGFLYTEGVITHPEAVLSLTEETDADGLPLANVVNVLLRNTAQKEAMQPQAAAFERHFAVSASCGLCGKNSIADLLITTPPLEERNIRITAATLYALPAQLRSEQTVFTHTGGLHAAGLFSTSGELLLLREDIGRHNAVDKIIGHGLLQPSLPSLSLPSLPPLHASQTSPVSQKPQTSPDSFPYDRHILLVSGRTSFEIIQKALLARIPCIGAISAPSSLAVELADRCGITLIGFLRDHSMNVYTHPERIV